MLPSGRELHIEGRAPGPAATLIVHDFRFVSRVLASADIGFGEGYMAGEWDTPGLAGPCWKPFTANFDRLEKLVEGNPVMRAINFLAHVFNHNSKRGARRQHPRPLRPRQRLLCSAGWTPA